MNRERGYIHYVRKFEAMLVALMMVCNLFLPGVAWAVTSDDLKDGVSFYKTAAAATEFVQLMKYRYGDSDTANTAIIGNSPHGDVVSVGNISAACGYLDVSALGEPPTGTAGGGSTDNSSKTNQWFIPASINSTGSQIYDWASYNNGNNVEGAIRGYGVYGYALKELGLDEVNAGSNLSAPSRAIRGYLLRGSYFAAASSHTAMAYALELLQRLNPFGFFFVDEGEQSSYSAQGNNSGVETSVNPSDYSVSSDIESEVDVEEVGEKSLFSKEGDVNADITTQDGALSYVIDLYRKIYFGIRSISLIVLLPLSLAIAIALYFLAKATKGNAQKEKTKFGLYARRFLFVLFGVPLLGTLYTSLLVTAKDSFTRTTAFNPNTVVLSSLCDFRGWVERNALNPSSLVVGISIVDHGSTNVLVSPDSQGNSRLMAYNINKKVYSDANLPDATVELTGGFVSNVNNLSPENKEISNIDSGDISQFFTDSIFSNGGESTPASVVNALLTSYTNGDEYTSASYEQYCQNKIENKSDLSAWLASTGNPAMYADGLVKILKNGAQTEGVTATGILFGADPKSKGSTGRAYDESYVEIYDAIKDASTNEDAANAVLEYLNNQDGGGATAGTDDKTITLDEGLLGSGQLKYSGSTSSNSYFYIDHGTETDNGLTPIGMYNYLNTDFDRGSYTIYSPVDSVTTQARISHYAVSFVGGPFIGLLMWFNSFTLLLAVAVTGIFYAFGMVVSNIRRSFSMLINIPLATIGVMTVIVRVIVTGLALIAELFGTILAYWFASAILMLINGFVTGNDLLSLLGIDSSNIMVSSASLVISLLFASLLYIIYIILALQLRVTITNGINDFVQAIVQKFMMGISGGSIGSSTSGIGVLGGTVAAATKGVANGVNPVTAVAGAGVTAGIASKFNQMGDDIESPGVSNDSSYSSNIESSRADSTGYKAGNVNNGGPSADYGFEDNRESSMRTDNNSESNPILRGAATADVYGGGDSTEMDVGNVSNMNTDTANFNGGANSSNSSSSFANNSSSSSAVANSNKASQLGIPSEGRIGNAQLMANAAAIGGAGAAGYGGYGGEGGRGYGGAGKGGAGGDAYANAGDLFAENMSTGQAAYNNQSIDGSGNKIEDLRAAQMRGAVAQNGAPGAMGGAGATGAAGGRGYSNASSSSQSVASGSARSASDSAVFGENSQQRNINRAVYGAGGTGSANSSATSQSNSGLNAYMAANGGNSRSASESDAYSDAEGSLRAQLSAYNSATGGNGDANSAAYGGTGSANSSAVGGTGSANSSASSNAANQANAYSNAAGGRGYGSADSNADSSAYSDSDSAVRSQLHAYSASEGRHETGIGYGNAVSEAVMSAGQAVNANVRGGDAHATAEGNGINNSNPYIAQSTNPNGVNVNAKLMDTRDKDRAEAFAEAGKAGEGGLGGDAGDSADMFGDTRRDVKAMGSGSGDVSVFSDGYNNSYDRDLDVTLGSAYSNAMALNSSKSMSSSDVRIPSLQSSIGDVNMAGSSSDVHADANVQLGDTPGVENMFSPRISSPRANLNGARVDGKGGMNQLKADVTARATPGSAFANVTTPRGDSEHIVNNNNNSSNRSSRMALEDKGLRGVKASGGAVGISDGTGGSSIESSVSRDSSSVSKSSASSSSSSAMSSSASSMSSSSDSYTMEKDGMKTIRPGSVSAKPKGKRPTANKSKSASGARSRFETLNKGMGEETPTHGIGTAVSSVGDSEQARREKSRADAMKRAIDANRGKNLKN